MRALLRLLLALAALLAFATPGFTQTDQLDPVERALEQMRQQPGNTDQDNRALDELLRQRRAENATTQTDGREVITRFDTRIDVERSGDILITETIELVAQGQQIKRGIFRELPRLYDFMGVQQDYDYDLISVTRDGRPENVTQMRNGNAIVWRIGRGEVLLDPGPYTYEIHYRVADAVIRHDNYDELYWNATGTYWDFPIERANATIVWPEGTEIRELNGYTGGFGTTTGAYTADAVGRTATFETTAPLPSKAGLTVSAIVEKGVIAPLSDARLAQLAWIRNGATIMLSLGGLGLLGYYLMMWSRVGRDPQKPPVFARYEPPEGYSPAAVHFIHHRTHKNQTALSAQLLHMGARGEVEIEAEDDVTVVHVLREPAHPDSRSLLKSLTGGKADGFTLDGRENSTLFMGVLTWLTNISHRYSRDYYRRNLGWSFLGMVASVALVLFVLLSDVSLAGPAVVALILGLVGLNILFIRLMPAPTNKGSKVSAEIEGFKLYLETAEQDRINTGGPLSERPPMMSVELYESFLPYAVALGVEKPWSKYFETVMPEAAREYRPSYGRGSAFRRSGGFGRGNSPIDFSRTVEKALTSGVAAAKPVPRSTSSGSFGSSGGGGWSSGGGGGGFSGGGGGGGGGGGW